MAGGIDDGFDFDAEDEAITDGMMAGIERLDEQMEAAARSNGTISVIDVVNQHSSNQDSTEEAHRQLQQRASALRYHYQDRTTFDAALELYNRTRCVTSINPSMGHVADEFWVRKEVRAPHKKPCEDCGTNFYKGMNMDYIQECGKGPYDAKKLCVGCMGRRLKREVGIDLDNIQQALTPLRLAQPNGIMAGGSFVQMFRQR
mmetsp:Transcript_32023/g.35871  ORF Transcript_32023/g.35871 Transcript_32023/m.35871 type:complete len:202 (-) Transcript_32023:242-847(-)|eukprot:CAMPEP_0170844158 /NCGR_PEP_ID=MMETSP0734-20130129/6714_1 /TAXON_ID=186038 /ORGANISM="Fragilariopsis kerguelensis, Strain L26-C5" /LENGTH=201 /DNA_ID=CAMNT_0011212519 /DNA_START=15 /DNA_END=620 /DNA_ORIENTATION=-